MIAAKGRNGFEFPFQATLDVAMRYLDWRDVDAKNRAGEGRLAVRLVKAASLAFIEAQRGALTEHAGGSDAGISQERQ